ncbi:hypothetical protein A3C23_01420 [Candidatus Roizmanbacteria bacterium RIFCSPHIGHO2_02_FULL_37_13b]|nr:MAG: hypothetical protein A3C23_01420 [Candidatus Roizmanbacteria bacterium RIFCSPHIGHO2_02_FULL_37_13b]
MKEKKTTILTRLITSWIFFTRYLFGLIFFPYRTMRQIVKEKDNYQLFFILIFVYGYFIFATLMRNKTLNPFILSSSSLITFIFFILTFILTTSFFYLLGKLIKRDIDYKNLLFSFAFSLFPTITWFLFTSVVYFLIPPPRTFSFLGKSFSLIFLTISLSLLIWKLLLFYLSLRFSLKLSFYRLMIFIILYAAWFIPYSIFMYQIKIFRIPFI